MDPDHWLEVIWQGNTLRAWLTAGTAFIATFTILPLVRGYIDRRRRGWHHESIPDGIELAALLVSRTSRLFILIVALYLAVRILTLPPAYQQALQVVIVVGFWAQAALWAMTAFRFWLDRRRAVAGDAARGGSFEILLFVARLVIASLALLLALDNLGIQIKPLLAGLGIGGIAVALAVQAVLGDLFASLSITLDKPFEVGDFLVIGEDKGTVERIGIKSTRLRSLSGEQLIVANSDLLKSRVRNFKRMHERRVQFTIGVVYETPREKVAEIPQIIRRAIEAQPKARFERCHLLVLGSSALEFETVYHLLVPDFDEYADAQQAINLLILEQFDRRGIEFAYPTQTQVVRTITRPS
jgi:small-conductance mechanosensitive channel